ncbi:SH3 domain containing protein [Acanthamoeba castellanii str. Neff]|uniref:SH3 domain containing protein n=1 Tax=Acanthamoeba castellanii (strain ATCC 30010 / Neff) TaxID=1257118 RepID=L8GJ29_ACACF|nr:SH3 domain containing protein [Acanthamoeba castellanii str. Neff]ELR12171.1 SH3 domain containing protein [Acanthamoeba castellanii str. Neff]
MAANWRHQKEERERLAREREEEERRKKEQKIKQLLLHAPTPSGKTSSPHLSSSSSSPATAQPLPRSTEPENAAAHHPPAKNDADEHNKHGVAAAAAAEVGSSGWTKPVAAQSSGPDTHRAKPSFLGQQQQLVVEANEVETIEALRAQLAKRDEEVRMLKEAYKERMREKEEEFKQRWAAQNEAEALAHKLNEAESRAKAQEAEAKRLREQVHQLELLVRSLKKDKKHHNKAPRKHINKHHHTNTTDDDTHREEMVGKKVIALYNFKGNEADGELSFVEGDVIEVRARVNEGWWEGRLTNGDLGIFPFNYVQPLVIFSSQSSTSAAAAASRVEHSEAHDDDHQRRHGQHHHHHHHHEEGEDEDDDEDDSEEDVAPAHPKMSTLEKAAYAKKKIEEKYKELSKSLLGPTPAEMEKAVDDHHQHAHTGPEADAAAAIDHEEADAPVEMTTTEGDTGNTEGKEEKAEELQSGVALFDFEAQNEGELSFKKGDQVLVLPLTDPQQHGQQPEGNGAGEWRYGYVGDHEGHFPTSYVSISATHTRD